MDIASYISDMKFRRNKSICVMLSLLILLVHSYFLYFSWWNLRNLHKSQSYRPGLEKTSDNSKHLLLDFLSEQNGPQCVNLRKPLISEVNHRQKYWQAHEDVQKKEDIVVYSAFYDDREIVGRLPWIRILGDRRVSDKPLWCYLWYSEFDAPIVTETEIIHIPFSRIAPIGGNTYTQSLFSCPLSQTNSTPTHVSLSLKLCNSSTIFLPIQKFIRPNGNWLHEFAICVPISFGYTPPAWIAEWIEIHSMFGVTKFNVYNASMDRRMDAVFDYYRKNGLLDVYQMPPIVNDYEIRNIKLSGRASLNDCMMRNMYRTRFIIPIDFDEVIVPRVHKTYREMLVEIDKSLNRKINHHTYSFRNAFFFHYLPEDKSQPAYLKTLRFQNRAPPSGYSVRPKSFVDPRQCKSVFNHYCMVRFNEKEGTFVDVNTSIALSHHYRIKCPDDEATCDKFDKQMLKDDVMLQFKKDLIARFSIASKNIAGLLSDSYNMTIV